MSKKLTYEQVKSYIESFNYQLLSTEYINNKTKLIFKCPENHKFEMTYNNFKYGQRCPICIGNKKLTYEQVKSYIESFNYQLLSNEYIDNKTKLKLQCPEGHIFEIRYKNFKYGNRCFQCYKKPYNEIKKIIELCNYKLISKTYKNAHTKLKLQCPEGHIFEMSYAHFNYGRRCPICWYNSKSSKPEREIQNYVSNIYDGGVINNDRNTIINPSTGYNLELDIYLPDINKAIEFNGSYWHSLPTNNDKVKSEQCRNNNIELLVVNEENWNNNKEFCLQIIENFINN